MSLFNELQRRNVFKVGIAYVVISWLVAQILQLVFESFGTPDWVMKTVLVLLATGLPFALFFAWAFEMTADGLKRESEVDRTQSITVDTGRKLDYAIIGVLVVALGYFAYDKFVLSDDRDAALVEATARAMIEQVATEQAITEPEVDQTDNSIAVLPFADMSPNKDQDYFSDGLSEELLNLLAKIPELRVAARTSSFSFKGQNLEIPDIAKRLKVAHILEGSVRTAGNKIRVTAQLIKADDGYHMWSETFDRDLDNIFAIQDEIATTVVAQLKVTLLGEAPKTQETNPEAFALYLQARHLGRKLTPESLEKSIVLYQKVLDINPGFASAWADLGLIYSAQTTNGLRPVDQGYALALEAYNKALEIDPDNVLALSRLAFSTANREGDLLAAARLHERALQLEPNNHVVVGNAASFLRALGRLEEAIVLHQNQVDLDPVNATALSNLALVYLATGRWDEALNLYRTVLNLSPERIGAHYFVGKALLLLTRPEAALEAFAEESDEEYRVQGSALALHSLGRQIEFKAALAELQRRWGERWPVDVAQVYSWAGDADAAFEWLEKGLELTGHFFENDVAIDPFLANLHKDPRWQPLLERAGASAAQLAAVEFDVKLPQ